MLEDPTYYYGYDAEGNKTSRTPKAGGSANTYSWDNRNRLVSSTASGNTVHQKYDALNRRIGTSSGGTTSWFGYDGEHVQAVHSTGTTVTERFLHGPDVDEVYGQEKNGAQRWLLTDGRGSVTGVTNASGSSTGQKNYNTFGGTQSESGVTDTLFAYTGREWDDAAGLQYSRNRWYDPSAKRWLSEDPIGFAGGDANLSRYVGNSPGTFTDPSGLKYHIIGGASGSRNTPAQTDRGINHKIDEEEALYQNNERLRQADKALGALEYERIHGTGLSPAQLAMYEELQNTINKILGVNKPARSGALRPVAPKSAFEEITGAVLGGFRVGGTAIINEGVKSAVGIATLGFYDPGNTIQPRQIDIDDGSYNMARLPARVAAEVATGAGLGKLAKCAGALGKIALGMDVGGNVVGVGKAGIDIANNGLNWNNGVELVGGLVGLASNQLGRYLPHCFVAGTPIATQHGLRPIETIEKRDKVWSFNFATEGWELREVVDVFGEPEDHVIVKMTIGDEVIEATNGHPFWVIEGERLYTRPSPEHHSRAELNNTKVPGRWVSAGDLRVGDVLIRQGNSPIRIDKLESRRQNCMVYNFHVEGMQNYAVGQNALLVHNNCNGAKGKAINDDLLEQNGISVVPPPKAKGMNNPKINEAVNTGLDRHTALQDKMRGKGWRVGRKETSVIDPATGTHVYPDAITPKGHPVEIKPPTDTGVESGKARLPRYERATGRKGRVVYW